MGHFTTQLRLFFLQSGNPAQPHVGATIIPVEWGHHSQLRGKSEHTHTHKKRKKDFLTIMETFLLN